MDYTSGSNRVILDFHLKLGFEGAQLTQDMELCVFFSFFSQKTKMITSP